MSYRTRWLIVVGVMLTLLGCGSQTRTITIRAENMRFVGDEIRLRAGETVNLRLVNRDGYAHAFDQDDYGLHATLAAKEVIEMTFTPDRPGTYSFYCGAPGHTSAGMVGTLIVDP